MSSLIQTYFDDKIFNVLDSPEIKNVLKLEILENYLNKQDEKSRIDERVLIMYIGLLAQSELKQRKRIKRILQSSNKYPLAECLEICRKYSVKDAWAYLEVKQGKVNNAINLSYQVIFCNRSSKIYCI